VEPDRNSIDRRGVARCDFLLAAAIAFVILTSMAMGLYPGSSDHNHFTHGYSFTVNFFSDLGATRTYAHHLNVASAVLFMIALAAVGLAIVVFSFNATAISRVRGKNRFAGGSARLCGIISGAAFICIAATPDNVNDSLHILFVQIAFSFLLLFVVFLLALQLGVGWPARYLVPNFIYLAILAAYVALLFFGPNLDTLHGLEIQAIGQKIIVYASILNVSIQAYGVRRFFRRDSAAA